MPTPIVSIAIDTPQPRLVGDRLAKVVSGLDWDLTASSPNVGVENVKLTGILMPLPYTAEWLTSGTGDYARLRKSQLSISGATDWTEFERAFTGDWWVHSLQSNIIVQTTASYAKNRPMFLSWLNYNVGNQVYRVMDCGWGVGSDREFGLRFWSDGTVQFELNGEPYAGTAKINESSYTANRYGKQGFSTAAPSKTLAGETVDVVLLPGRRNELIVLSNQGGGFCLPFAELDPEDPDPTIVGPGPFRFSVPEGQATVQIAPLKFRHSGALNSPVFRLREAPGVGEVHTEGLNWDGAGYGTQSATASLVEADGVTPFVPNGFTDLARIRVDLSGDGDSTPFVYAASSGFDALTATLEDAATILDRQPGERGWWMSAELEVPDDPESVSLRVHISDPAGLEERGAVDLRGTGNRDIEAAIGDIRFFIGRTLEPETDTEGREEAEQMVLDCRDRSLQMEEYLIQDPEPLDTMNFSDAIRYLAKLPGFTDADLDVGDIDFNLPSVPQNSEGEWAYMPEVGDTSTMWIRKLWEEFAQKCYRGWVPTASGVVYRFKTPEQLGTTPQVTLYLSEEAAILDGVPPGYYNSWIREWKPRALKVEANDIRVFGRDPKTLLPIVWHWRDPDSIDPTLLPEDRPDNWIGNIRQYTWVDPSLTSDYAVSWALSNLISVLAVKRHVAQFKCEFLIRPDGAPVWRGDVVEILGTRPNSLGENLDGLWRIRTLSAVFDLEHAHPTDGAFDRIWRECTYVAEKI